MSKDKRQARQDERDIKLLDNVLEGKVKIAVYEKKKKASQANRKGGAAPTEEAEEEMMTSYARFLRILLPGIMAKLSRIEDPRDPRKVRHSLPFLLLIGIIMFLSHRTSRRSVNRTIVRSSVLSMVEEFVPGVNDMPHADTLARLLSNIDAEKINIHYEEMIKEFINSNQFKEVQSGRFRVAIDGTRKFSRKYKWDDRALHQNADDEDKQLYYVSVLESVLILNNGMTLPLLTEFMENEDSAQNEWENQAKIENNSTFEANHGGKDNKKSEDSDQKQKQDCETKAFHRLSKRLVKLLGKGCVSLVLDGLYATGPIISRCNEYGWDYMISLKHKCLKTVWEDFNGLREIEPNNTLKAQWGQRGQLYNWSNGLEYTYGNNHKRLKLNLVTCRETWIEEHPRSGGKPKIMTTEYAWLSSKRISENNVFELCTIIARSRWHIENSFLTLKHQGYNYTHCYSYKWNVMKGFHYLMKFGRFLNVLIAYSESLSTYVQIEGQRGFVKTVWDKIIAGKWSICESTVSTKEEFSDTTYRRKKVKYPSFIKAA